MAEPTIRTAPVAVGGHFLPAARRLRRSPSPGGCMLMIPRHPGAGFRHPPPAGSCPLVTSEAAPGAVIRAGSGELDRQTRRIAVHDCVDYLCTTARSLCVLWGNAGDCAP